MSRAVLIDERCLSVLLHWIPRHHWVHLIFNWRGDTERGHDWQYAGLVRRDAWRVWLLGFAVMRMPLRAGEAK